VAGSGDASGGAAALQADGVDEAHEMDWTEYALAMLLFSGASMLLLYTCWSGRSTWLPWLNPQKLAGVPPALAFNTAASFTTNTNWQNYS
jgi:K+-transporting ATPase ATPase A chain